MTRKRLHSAAASRTNSPRSARARSARYPGVPLGDCIELCRFMAGRGLDGLPAAAIASALGHRNVRTNSFSARLSAARQFGLLSLESAGYSFTPLARRIAAAPESHIPQQLLQAALRQPPLYAALIERLAAKRVPDVEVLAALIERQYPVTGAAKRSAAEAFLASARYASALGEDQVLRLTGEMTEVPVPERSEVQIDLPLWGPDQGRSIRVRAPERITRASFERLLQALRLHLRIAEPSPAQTEEESGAGSGPR